LKAEPIKISDNLFLIKLIPPIRGFDNFIGSWLYRGEKNFIVDVGPSVTANSLLTALDDLNIESLDYIFLTHIHIDHAGGTGEIAERFPNATIICHKAGIQHLVDPVRLWKGSVKTLGDTGRAYGPIKPVPEKCFTSADDFVSDIVTPVITPGHAQHHVSYNTDQCLFAGEAAGVYLSLPSGQEYFRPATPPRFFMETSVNSINALIKKKPEKICYGHFGIKNNAVKMLEQQRAQLMLWNKIIDDEMKTKGEDFSIDLCINRLTKEDPLLEGFFSMDEDVRERERVFLRNSVKGFAGYLSP